MTGHNDTDNGVYFRHSGFVDHHIEKMYNTIEKQLNSSKKSIQIVGGDFHAELGPGYGEERVSVGPHTLKEVKKRTLDEAVADDTELHRTVKTFGNVLPTDHLKGQRNTLITY